ncbi:polysaccharide deacetylase family protein [Labrenzia sp. DG1229]|uniref:polysaccharide deacetylase family protein n=1 Tax=Labrenzia sp. DG1229 TaxID=681847 RepID=UPI00048E5B05|nr:polysaccharide deacetylase family protein [Labrenzia sp. DG1229]
MPKLALLYHKIVPGPRELEDPFRISVSLQNFEEQISVLKRKCRIVSLAQWLHEPVGDEPVALITIDDGYSETLKVAEPVLAREDARGIAFVCPGHVGMGSQFWWDRLQKRTQLKELEKGAPVASSEWIRNQGRELMQMEYSHARAKADVLCRDVDTISGVPSEDRIATWEELRALDSNVIEIAHHGFEHHCFSALPLAVLSRQFGRSHAAFSENSITAAPVLAYPYGFRGCVTIDQIRECVSSHFIAGFTTIKGIVDTDNSNPYLMARNYVGDWNGDQFEQWIQASLS